MGYLIDTDTLIFSFKKDKSVNRNFMENKDIPMSISVISYGELVYGAEKSSNPQKNSIIVDHVKDIFPVIDINQGIINVFAKTKAQLEKKGNRIEDMDLLIAATAIYNDMILVTNNVSHFERIPELRIENWKMN